jgi:hypothetical protein
MSIVVLKRNSHRFQKNISGQGKDGFSLVGGHRNVGSVGPTNLAKSVTRTRFRGTQPMGHGSTNGVYKISVCNSGSCCNNDPNIIKATVKSNKGSIIHQYKWLHSGYPNYWVKSDDARSEESHQSVYISVLTAKHSACVVNKKDTGIIKDSGCDENSNKNTCKAYSYYIGGKRHYRTLYSKDLNVYPQSCGQYISTRYLKKNNLPTPDCLKPFPMTLNHNGCDKNYFTPEEAIADGALPSDWMNCVLPYECNKCPYVFDDFKEDITNNINANVNTSGQSSSPVNYMDNLSNKDDQSLYLDVGFPFYFFGVNYGNSNNNGIYFSSKFILGFGALPSGNDNTKNWGSGDGPAILLGNGDRYMKTFHYSGTLTLNNIQYIRIVTSAIDNASDADNPVYDEFNYELFLGRDDCYQYVLLRVATQAVTPGNWNITDGTSFKNTFPNEFNALTGGKYLLRSDLFGNNWKLFTDRSIGFK